MLLFLHISLCPEIGSIFTLFFLLLVALVSPRGHRHSEDHLTWRFCGRRRSRGSEWTEQRQKLQTAVVQKTSRPTQWRTSQGDAWKDLLFTLMNSSKIVELNSQNNIEMFLFNLLGDSQIVPVRYICCRRCQWRFECGMGETFGEEEKAQVINKENKQTHKKLFCSFKTFSLLWSHFLIIFLSADTWWCRAVRVCSTRWPITCTSSTSRRPDWISWLKSWLQCCCTTTLQQIQSMTLLQRQQPGRWHQQDV